MHYIKLIPILLLMGLLIACGGDENTASEDVPYTPTPVQAPTAKNTFSQFTLDTQHKTVSLASNVSDPQGLPLTLEAVTSLSPECENPPFDRSAMTFSVSGNQPESCYYQYTVKNHSPTPELDKTSIADSFVIVSTSMEDAELPPVSEIATVGETIEINLHAELGSAYPVGYVLQPSVIVLGNGSAVANSTNNTITYQATARGITRLLYSLLSEDGQDIKSGYIDVSVSGEVNYAPIANDFEEGPVIMQETRTIDVQGHIFDVELGSMQLTDVYAYGAEVSVLDAQDMTNTRFTFKADTPGYYTVRYSITDHQGGWANANVVVDTRKPYADIHLNGVVYRSMPVLSEAEKMGLHNGGIVEESIYGTSPGVLLPVFTQEVAAAWCQAQGLELPTEEILDILFTNTGSQGLHTSDNWPTLLSYWTVQEGISYDLERNVLSPWQGDVAYVTCTTIGHIVSVEIMNRDSLIKGEIAELILTGTDDENQKEVVLPELVNYTTVFFKGVVA